MAASMRLDPFVLVVVALALSSQGGEARAAWRVDDARDIRDAARGDQAALGRLYDRYGRMVFALALRVIGERGAAEEITQDVFLQLWRHAADFDPTRGALVAWLVTITRTRAIDRLRSPQQRASEAWLPLEDEALSSKPMEFLSGETERLTAALASLPEQQRRVVELAYYEGLTQSEIAARLEQPLGTVKTWTRSAFKTLREVLQS